MCAALIFGFGRASYAVRSHDISMPRDIKRAILCRGTITETPQEKRWGLRFILRLSACSWDDQVFFPTKGSVRVNANYRFVREDLLAGDRVQVKFKFKVLSELEHPSFKHYLLSHGIGAKATARGQVEIVSRGKDPLHIIQEGRKRVYNSLSESIPQPQADIVAALATGKRDGIDDDIRDQFSRAGIAHLLAISGLHVGYVALIIYFLIRITFGRLPWLIESIPLARMAAALTIPLTWLYVFFTGCAMSTIRAGTMLSIYLMGIILGIRQDLITTIAAAVISIIVFSPLSILDISFQLSVAAVIGIALVAMPLIRQNGFLRMDYGIMRRLMGWISATLIITFAATTFTAPLIAYHFKIFTATGLLANLVAVPLVGFALQPSILAASVLSLIAPSMAFYVWKLVGLLASSLINIAQITSDLGSLLSGRWALSWQGMFLAYAVLAIITLICWNYWLTFSHDTNRQPKGPFSRVA